uniref:EF-hand domain-containing protein n=1 Tax=Hanusia phi TaxID=3032 RepID=A0A7S0DUE3_9CRYP|mmetsp:Transcript_10308/g.23559  ORF Transcript_10308/g.23559 Transcript_10308/m.23559 type:complete len:220 (+) Transcript_10308:31-690(+)
MSAVLACNLPGQLHAGLVAHPKKSKTISSKRHDALLARSRFWREVQREKKVEQLMEKYDKSRTGNLNVKELGDFLQDAAKGIRPSDEEINFVMRSAQAKDGGEGDSITKSEIMIALDVWRHYEKTKPEIEAYFKKYDTNNSGMLEFDQLKNLLTDLNDGVAPPDEEIKWIQSNSDGSVRGIQKTGGVNKTELMGAIALWYTHIEEASNKTTTSSCCVIH